MENNVHHDVYNADVCTRAQRGKHRGRRKRKRSEWDRGGARRVMTRGKKRIKEERQREEESNDKRKKDDDKSGREREGHADEGKGGGREGGGRRGRVEARREAKRGVCERV